MNSEQNKRMNNTEQRTGNVAAYFHNIIKNLIQTNNGTRSFFLRTVDCHDQAAPFDDSQYTTISITHTDHDISQITDGFLTFKIRQKGYFVGLNPAFKDNDPNHLFKSFIGLKSSSHILDQLFINNRNKSTGYTQNEMVREGFAYSTLKPHNEKKTKKYTHSLYENVENYSESAAGVFVNLADYADGKEHIEEYEINIPFDDILALQAFDMFPNFCVGDIELKFYIKKKGFVYALLNPEKVRDYKAIREGEDLNATFSTTTGSGFTHAFSQVNNPSYGFTNVSKRTETIGGQSVDIYTPESGEIRYIMTGLSAQSIKSNMYGFKISERSKQSIYNLFKQPVYIPSQELNYNAFPLAATQAGIQSTLNIPLDNVTCFSVMFPKHDNDYTVFENPIYDNCQLTVKDTLTCQIFCAYEEVMLDMSYKPEILATYLKLFKLQYTLIFKNKNILFRNYIIILCEIYIKTYFASVTFFFISILYD
ncbi:protein of unknown function (DUF3447) [Trichomonas vaginalis G3]|uniref:protein of unknown function (DUF3447) n=1 Tax=Trichomonas vaginalis (strain ATCC PRA-98 / G3) TaxID=412133 RepID=UPI0021E54718|nr:protein of unknown function (DUF3447) [Trichomonas vaginalis G3]KAI5533007.1 protein of unknown function (DUF3447) [Trichomonas vaginalis G3]